MSLITKGATLLMLGSAAVSACATSPSRGRPTPVEVWRGGDDGLTVRFADALEAAFRAAPEFSLSTGKAPGTLIVTISSNVTSKQDQGRSEVSYSVQFTSVESQVLGSSNGTCREGRLQECAAHVLTDLKTIKKIN